MCQSQLFVAFLFFDISLATDVRTVLICENNIMSIKCSLNSTISVSRANYGRFSIGVCNDQANTDIDIHCDSEEKTTAFLKERLDGNIYVISLNVLFP